MSDQTYEHVMYAVNHDAMYWRARCLEAEAELERVENQLRESISLNMKQISHSEKLLLTAIMSGAFDKKKEHADGEAR